MILGDPKTADGQPSGRATLDGIFRRAVARRPDAVALADPPNRSSFTDGPPRRLSYAEADRIVSSIAERLHRLGLKTDSVVALQLPNTVESVLTILGVLRAGMIAAPMPLLWRRADAIPALTRAGAKAIVTASRIGDHGHCDLAMQMAAEVFPIRYVCGFGAVPPDGVIPFNDLLSETTVERPAAVEREGNPAAHTAIVTWEATREGPVAVARNHMELIAGGLGAMLEGRLEQGSAILGCCTLSSFASLALTVMPWLLTGGTLALHQPFDPAVFSAQCRDENCDTVILPGALVPRLAEAKLLNESCLKNILALWRAPERLHGSPPWRHPRAGLVDMLAFGETALLGARRETGGEPASLSFGVVMAPRGAAGAMPVAELSRSEAGNVALRGPMVPRYAFPPGAERTDGPRFRPDAIGFVDTGYPCRVDRDTKTMTVTGPPPGIVSVGGYRFMLSELQDMVERADESGGLAALPDGLAGHRLAGIAANPDVVRAELQSAGINPLVADAFRDRRAPDAA